VCGIWLATSMLMRRLTSPLALAMLLMAIVPVTSVAASSRNDVVGTWRGSAEEFSSPHIQGRAQVTVDVMPDGRWISVWRQAGRERRSTGTWRLTPELIVFEADSAEAVPPRLSLRHRGDVVYGTALAPLPEGRSAIVAIALTHVASTPVASRPGL
jgi:hypothetical protein